MASGRWHRKDCKWRLRRQSFWADRSVQQVVCLLVRRPVPDSAAIAVAALLAQGDHYQLLATAAARRGELGEDDDDVGGMRAAAAVSMVQVDNDEASSPTAEDDDDGEALMDYQYARTGLRPRYGADFDAFHVCKNCKRKYIRILLVLV
jgi:hypothetical protein